MASAAICSLWLLKNGSLPITSPSEILSGIRAVQRRADAITDQRVQTEACFREAQRTYDPQCREQFLKWAYEWLEAAALEAETHLKRQRKQRRVRALDIIS
jgi:hypothetical protein